MPPTWALLAGGSLLLSAVAFGTGWQVRSWKADSDELDAVQAGIERGREKQELEYLRASQFEQESQDAEVVTHTREQQIRTIFREIEVPAECEPPAAVLQLLDNALRDANQRASGDPGAGVSAPAAAPDGDDRP